MKTLVFKMLSHALSHLTLLQLLRDKGVIESLMPHHVMWADFPVIYSLLSSVAQEPAHFSVCGLWGSLISIPPWTEKQCGDSWDQSGFTDISGINRFMETCLKI